jgi:hypothetical protein
MYLVFRCAPLVKLADTLDLGSSAQAWGFKSLAGHQFLPKEGVFQSSLKRRNRKSKLS